MKGIHGAYGAMLPAIVTIATVLISTGYAEIPESGEPQVARVTLTEGGVYWEPLRAFDVATIQIRSPFGDTIKGRFEAGTNPSFELQEHRGLLPDGAYVWEMHLQPSVSEDVRRELREAARIGDLLRVSVLNRLHHIQHRDLVVTGQFFIREGSIAGEEGDAKTSHPFVDTRRNSSKQEPPRPPAATDVSGNWTISGDLGIGTDSPSQEIDIVDATPTMQMEDSSIGFSWFVNGNETGFDIRRNSNTPTDRVLFLDPAAPRPSLWINSLGNWGNGTSLPSAPLHLSRNDGTAFVYVTERSAVTAQRNLFQLENNGGPLFVLKNANTNATWFFSMNPNDDFQFSRSGTGGPELLVAENGQVQMGPGADVVFNLLPNGDLTIAGDLTANGMFYPSDRNLKQDVVPVNPARILDELAQLPVSFWSWKSDASGRQHVGPMAQDFQAAFRLGPDDRHINAMDLAGVTLAGVQGLYRRLRQQEVRIERQQAEIDRQRDRIRRLTDVSQRQSAEIEQLRADFADLVRSLDRP